MCGRYYVDEETAKEIERLVHQLDRKYVFAPGDKRPTDLSCVIRGAHTGLEAEMMSWGFPGIPPSKVLFNARCETALIRPTFRDSVLKRRCMIPASRFYEWDRHKHKVTFYRKGFPVIYLAGFYRKFWETEYFTILTTEANTSVKSVHGRMPLVLEPSELNDWIYDERAAEKLLQKEPPALEKMAEYEQQTLPFF